MPLIPWNASQTVNSTTTGDQTYSKMAQLNDGTMVVVWLDASSGNQDVRFQRYDAIGNKLGIETLAHSPSASNQTTCNVTALSDGGFVISYVDIEGNALFGQKFTATGLANGAPAVLSSPALSNIFVNYIPVVQSLAGDEYAVFYTTDDFDSVSSGTDLVGRIVSAAGVPGAAFNVAQTSIGTQFAPSATLDASGNLVVTWTGNGGGPGGSEIVMRRFSPSGNGLTNEFVVNTTQDTTQSASSVTRLSNGLFAVTWYSDAVGTVGGADIRGQIVNASGTKIGGEFLAGTTQAGEQYFSDIVPLSDGKFAVIYATSGGVNHPLRAQMFNSNGTTAGAELLVSATGMSSFTIPSAVTLADGRLALTWADRAADGSSIGIRLQILDPREGVINGTAGADKLWGNNTTGDFIVAGDGADIIYGLAGADTIYGDAGIDNIYGGRGDDTVYGGADNDIIYGDLGDDEQYGEAGNDIIYSAGGADLMDGGAGTGDAAFYVNELLGAVVNLTDQLLTGGSALGDTLFNFERVYGSVRGANNLTGDTNANILVGGLVNDTLDGGGGADVLRGWGGVDTMSGGANNDIFQYTGNTEGGDIITDFAAGDKFQFVRTAFGNLAGANVAAANFLSVASGHAATNASQRFIFDQATKQLWYDADGNAGGAGVMIADLSTAYNILNTDLLLA